MQNRLKVGLDLDDTILSFFDHYKKHFDVKNNPKMMEDSMITRNVHKLRNNKSFWEGLEKIQEINFIPELYCTKRVNSKVYTKNSLIKNGFPLRPIYQVMLQKGNKAKLIKGKVDVFIDDSVSNFEDLNSSGVFCLLIDAPHNRKYQTPLRIYDLNYETIEKTYNKWKNN